jgi:hypothetical protein
VVVFNTEWYHHAGPRMPVPRLHRICLTYTDGRANVAGKAAPDPEPPVDFFSLFDDPDGLAAVAARL